MKLEDFVLKLIRHPFIIKLVKGFHPWPICPCNYLSTGEPQSFCLWYCCPSDWVNFIHWCINACGTHELLGPSTDCTRHHWVVWRAERKKQMFPFLRAVPKWIRHLQVVPQTSHYFQVRVRFKLHKLQLNLWFAWPQCFGQLAQRENNVHDHASKWDLNNAVPELCLHSRQCHEHSQLHCQEF